VAEEAVEEVAIEKERERHQEVAVVVVLQLIRMFSY
jgi:hypothetical protein